MTFADVPAGTSLFLDANTLVYYFQPHPVLGPACNDLIRRIEHQQVAGFTSAHILAEIAHRLMTIEASQTFGWPSQASRIVSDNIRRKFASSLVFSRPLTTSSRRESRCFPWSLSSCRKRPPSAVKRAF